MLKEIGPVRQIPGEPRRRWFSSPDCDLVVWYGEDGSPIGLHLSYDKRDRERALLWNAPDRFTHTGIDSGETHALRYKATPIHVADGVFDGERVTEIFRREARELPADIVDMVVRKISEYERPRHQDRLPAEPEAP